MHSLSHKISCYTAFEKRNNVPESVFWHRDIEVYNFHEFLIIL